MIDATSSQGDYKALDASHVVLLVLGQRVDEL